MDSGENGEQVIEPWMLEWQEAFQKATKFKGPNLKADRYLAGDALWSLWRRGGGRSGKGGWRNYSIYLISKSAPKRVWHVGWHPDGDRIAGSVDSKALQDHYPQVLEWVKSVAKHGPRMPPTVKIQTRENWIRQKRRYSGGAYEERRRERQRGYYRAKRSKTLELQAGLANEVSPSVAEVCLSALHELWEAKTPLSIRRQAGMQRFAPEILSKLTGVSSDSLEAWIKRMIAEGRIAEEVVCKKTKLRGLKVL
jgi:hypothetical protein